MNRLLIAALLAFSLFAIGPAEAGVKKVYLINGLLSKVFGYGLTNLSKKMPYARHFKFAGGVTQATIDGIIADATRAYNADSSVRISLIGISAGGKAIVKIARALNKKGVRVHYLGIVEGGNTGTIPANVGKADNFICTGGSCSATPARLAPGNNITRLKTITLDTGHIDSGNHPTMHRRVMAQVN